MEISMEVPNHFHTKAKQIGLNRAKKLLPILVKRRPDVIWHREFRIQTRFESIDLLMKRDEETYERFMNLKNLDSIILNYRKDFNHIPMILKQNFFDLESLEDLRINSDILNFIRIYGKTIGINDIYDIICYPNEIECLINDAKYSGFFYNKINPDNIPEYGIYFKNANLFYMTRELFTGYKKGEFYGL